MDAFLVVWLPRYARVAEMAVVENMEAEVNLPMQESVSRPRVTVLICTLNEEECLPHVLPAIPESVGEILIVDGHSTDRTVEVAIRLCPSARIIFQPGKGKGDALKHGISQATGDIIVMLDADGETDPRYVPDFVGPLLDGRVDFVKGSRLTNGRPQRMPRYRWLGNRVLAITYNLLYGTRFTDICSGYIAFRKRSFDALSLTYDNCEMEQQMLVRARKAGMRIVEVPHASDGRIAGMSKVSGVKQGFIDWFVIIGERIRA